MKCKDSHNFLSSTRQPQAVTEVQSRASSSGGRGLCCIIQWELKGLCPPQNPFLSSGSTSGHGVVGYGDGASLAPRPPQRACGRARGLALPLPDVAVSFIFLPKPFNFSLPPCAFFIRLNGFRCGFCSLVNRAPQHPVCFLHRS